MQQLLRTSADAASAALGRAATSLSSVISPSKTETFRETFPFERRATVAAEQRRRHPDRIPVIVERSPSDKVLSDIAQKKFLVPLDVSAAKFQSEVRKHVHIGPEQAMFIFVMGGAAGSAGIMPNHSSTMEQLYGRYKDDDGFLYVCYSGENTFGASELSF